MVVEDLVPLYEVFLGDSQDTSPPQARAILNAARIAIWRTIVIARGKEYWFGETSQWADSGAANYFPVFVQGQKQYALPSDFHSLVAIRAETDAYRGLVFADTEYGDDDELRLHAETSVRWGTRIPYTIVGPAPGQLTFFNEPPATIEATLVYIRMSRPWTTLKTNIDEFPESCHDLICEWAAQRTILGLNDRRMVGFEKQWRQRVLEWFASARRDMTSRPVVSGYFEGM